MDKAQKDLDGEREALRRRLLKQEGKLRRKELELQAHLDQCTEWPRVRHEADLIKAHLGAIPRGASSTVVRDWMTAEPIRLVLDPSKTAQEEMTARYRRAKKWQAAIEPLKRYLETLLAKIHRIEEACRCLERLQTAEELMAFRSTLGLLPSRLSSTAPKRRSPASAGLPSRPFNEYLSMRGMTIWVGKNARGNEALTFRFARRRDWWLHARGVSGSHVVICAPKEGQPDSESVQDALQLAVYHSKARVQGEGEICLTECKYVSKGGRPGLVQVAKYRTVRVRLDGDRCRNLLKRKCS